MTDKILLQLNCNHNNDFWVQNGAFPTASVVNNETNIKAQLGKINTVSSLLSFTGTDFTSLPNVTLDFLIPNNIIVYGNKDSKVRVHSGFMLAYLSIRPMILGAIKDEKVLLVSGHSLGGALATLCALDIQYNFPEKNIELKTFGCPKVGNKAFVKSFNKRVTNCINYRNGNDVVTKLPPWNKATEKNINIGKKRVWYKFSIKEHIDTDYQRYLG